MWRMDSTSFYSRGVIPLADAVKKCVNVPIITVNSVSPELGEQALLDGKADFVVIWKAKKEVYGTMLNCMGDFKGKKYVY